MGGPRGLFISKSTVRLVDYIREILYAFWSEGQRNYFVRWNNVYNIIYPHFLLPYRKTVCNIIKF